MGSRASLGPASGRVAPEPRRRDQPDTVTDPPGPAAGRGSRVAKPVILAVDDDPPVLRAIERDLRARYGHDQRIVAADSGQHAVDVLGELRLRGTPVAVIVTDQRMPGLTGIDVLARARELAPDAKRVLLTDRKSVV